MKPGQTVVEATSGNTGIALAMVCAARGYPFVATMVETFSIERRKIMRALGAKVILTPAAERGTGMVRRAAELAEKHGWFLARQFENPANPAYHRQTTGPEILRDFAGRRLDYWVTGWGTGGTLTGAGEVIKLARPEVKIIATEPAGASLLGGKTWAPHKIQGWTPDFLPDVLNPKVFDQLLPVTDEEGKNMARRLAREEGIFVGISSGATLAAALKVAETREAGLGAARDAARHGRALSRHVSLRRLERGLRRRVARELGQEVTPLRVRKIAPARRRARAAPIVHPRVAARAKDSGAGRTNGQWSPRSPCELASNVCRNSMRSTSKESAQWQRRRRRRTEKADERKEAQHPRHLGRRHRHLEPELLHARAHGLPDAEHRPPGQGRHDVHRLATASSPAPRGARRSSPARASLARASPRSAFPQRRSA